MTEWVLIIVLTAYQDNQTPVPIATFQGTNAMQNCVSNGKRIQAAGMFGRQVRAHCERIDR